MRKALLFAITALLLAIMVCSVAPVQADTSIDHLSVVYEYPNRRERATYWNPYADSVSFAWNRNFTWMGERYGYEVRVKMGLYTQQGIISQEDWCIRSDMGVTGNDGESVTEYINSPYNGAYAARYLKQTRFPQATLAQYTYYVQAMILEDGVWQPMDIKMAISYHWVNL